MKTAFLFPGQGAQQAGMLQSFPSGDPLVLKARKEAEAVLDMPFETLDTEANLQSTVYVQICLLIAGVITAQKLISKGVKADFVAGHSIGAFAAAVISGVLTFSQALVLVKTRATLMQEAYPSGYGMLAVVGFSRLAVQQYLQVHNQQNPTVYLANSNGADQQVIAGSRQSLLVLLNSIQHAGLRKGQLLNISVPSHCKLLNGVSAALKDCIDHQVLGKVSIPYLSNHSARILKQADQIGTDLWKSLSSTVEWYDGTTLLYELGTRCFIEMAPSGVLAKLAENAFPEANILSVEAQNEDTIAWLWKSQQNEMN